jgi:Flp pilus assembly CpaF family ATPase
MSKRKRGEKLQYMNKNSNSLVHKVKALKAELKDEKEKSELRLGLLKELLKAETISEHMLNAIVRYVEADGDFSKQGFIKDIKTGALEPLWLFSELRDENIYSALVLPVRKSR